MSLPFEMTEPQAAVALLVIAGLIAMMVILVPSRAIPLSRRRQRVDEVPSLLTRATSATTTTIAKTLDRSGRTRSWETRLDQAGIRMSPADFVLLVGAGTLASAAFGFLLGGLVFALIMVVVAIGAVAGFVSVRSDKRTSDFADQLEDLVQLLASNLRAGHSVVQSLDSLIPDLEEPARSEVARAVNQVRLGRDLSAALDDAANRMSSEDFRWIAQAVAIHRQVGGNLADVLDTTGETIRERSQIRRQVKALSAEGRMSAMVLMLLPVGVFLVITAMNPLYRETFSQTVAGWTMLAACAVLMTIGWLWLRRIIQVQF